MDAKTESLSVRFEGACDGCIVRAYMLRELRADEDAAATAAVRTMAKLREN